MYLCFFAAIIAYFVKGLCGFASTLVFTSVLSFGTVNVNISPVALLLGYPANLILAWKNRKKLDAGVCVTLSVLVIAGSIPGAFILKNVDTHVIKVIFGIVVVFSGIEMFAREYSKKGLKASKILMWIVGILAGLLCGMFGVGALLAAYISRVTDDSNAFKANISAVYIVENTFRIIMYGCMHILTLHSIKMSLLLIPFALLGTFAGIKCSNKIEEKRVKKITSVLLIVSGISLILETY